MLNILDFKTEEYRSIYFQELSSGKKIDPESKVMEYTDLFNTLNKFRDIPQYRDILIDVKLLTKVSSWV